MSPLNNRSSNRKLPRTLVAATLLLAISLTTSAATIYYVGTLTNSTETVNWLTPSVPKTYDVDGDNVYGSYAGVLWVSYGNYTSNTIGYVSSGGQYQQPEYPMINSLADACQGNTGPGAALTKRNPVNINASIALVDHVFVVNADLTGVTLRVGVMTDCLGAGEQPSDIHRALVVFQTAGGTAQSAVVPIPDANGQPDMSFFDIVDAQAGDQYEVECLCTTGAFSPLTAYVGDFSWDTNATAAVPATTPVVVSMIPGATVRTNGGYHLGALVGGAPSVSYQWYKGASPIARATGPTFDLSYVTAADAATYSLVASTAAASVTNTAVVSVVATNLPMCITVFETAAFALPGLYAYYSFENGLLDSVGTNNGSYAGTPAFGLAIGAGAGLGIDKGLACNGGDGRAMAGPDANLDFNNANFEGTVCAWIRPGWSQNLQNEYFIADGSTSAIQWALGIGGALNNILFSNGAAVAAPAIPALSTTNWYFVSAVFSNGTYRLFLDGALVGNGSQALGGTSGQPLIIGAIDDAGDNAWSGGIDEVAIYTNALPDSAIAGLYNAFLASDPPEIVIEPPAGDYYQTGTPLSFGLTVAGNLLSYQWYQNGSPIIGANTNSLSFAGLAAANVGTYVCVITNLAGTVTSSPTVIQVGSLTAAVLNYDSAVTNTPGLISFYKFDDFTANDDFGTNNGTLMGATQFTPGFAGGPDQALTLGGAGFDELGSVSDFNFSGGVGTVELWLKATIINGNACIFASRDDNSVGVDYSIHIDSSGDVYFWNGSTAPTITLPAPPGTNWHHLAVIFDSGTWTVVWDGAVAGTGNQYLGGAVSPTHLGSSNPTGTELWDGELDEVAFYSTALTPAQVAAHYTAFASSFPPRWSSQPVGLLLMTGAFGQLAGSASGLNLGYQWYKNGAAIANATTDVYTIARAAAPDQAGYTLVVTNASGSITSAVASLAVVAPHAAAYEAAVLATPGLVSFYPFNAGNANDYVSTNNGVANGNVTYTNDFSGGLALLLDGASWIDFGNVSAFDVGSGGRLTLEAWVRADWDPSSPPAYDPTIFGNSATGGPVAFSVQMSADKNSIIAFGAQDPIPNAGTNWHHLVVSLINPEHYTFWDGRQVAFEYGGLQNLNCGESMLGSTDPSGATNQWIGALDNVAYYDTTLLQSNVNAHYYAMLPPQLSASASGTNVIVSWPAGFSGWVLDATGSLSPATWTPVPTNTPVVVPETGGNKFFRLRKL
jgi:hypothetical protein